MERATRTKTKQTVIRINDTAYTKFIPNKTGQGLL